MESTLCFYLLALLSSLSLAYSQYVLQDHYFINCGSKSNVDYAGRNFVGDVKPSSFSVSGGRAVAENKNSIPNTQSIYRTARVFTKKSWYDLDLEARENNTFVMVRLYFSPLSSNEFESSDSKFEVSVSGFSLLSNFKVGNANVTKEFIVPSGSDRSFTIEFTPSNGSSSAFVNAIEAFKTPSNLFTPDVPLPHISPAGQSAGSKIKTASYAFIPIHRINVGGKIIDVKDDILRRKWVPDDPFIFNSTGPARNSTPFDGQINYRTGELASRFDAPDDVYNTAKQLDNKSVNITWKFVVNKKAMFLVRAYFCDIISPSYVNPNDAFNFFIYSHYNMGISPVQRAGYAIPFYEDLVVDSDESGFMNICIGWIDGSNQTPFLNGLEIMELLKNSSLGDQRTEGKKSKSVYIKAGCVVGGVAVLLILLVGFFIGLKYGKAKPVVGAKPESHAMPSYGQSSYTSINIDFTINHPSPIPNLNLSLRVPFADILQATNNFDENLMIGKGGFGKVYKGTLTNGMKVAVKRGEKGHGQGRPEFVTEIMVLSRIRHRHLVSLIGYCDEKSEMILVYEFMEKGTLQDHLYDANEDHPKLSWNRRLDICISASQGLNYLHTGSDGGIIHRDVKSTNILLNEHYVAKVADFGISRLDNVDQSDVSDIKGSFGYLDPEYIGCMKLTQKSDVYSFGVVLLEVLCARPAIDNKLPHNEANLADWAIRHITNGNVDKIVDPFLAGTINPNSLRKFLETVEGCLKNTGDERPNMLNVLWDLEYALKFQQMAVDREPYEDSTMNTSLQLPMSLIHRLPSHSIDVSEVNDSLASSYPSESQVFSQLKIEEAR